MLIIEKLSLKNIKYLKKLQLDSKNQFMFNKDFFEVYNNESFVAKYIKRKEVKLFKYNNNYIGYLWIEYPIEQTINVLALYINENYTDLVKKELNALFKNKSLAFDSLDNKLTYKIMKELGFNATRVTSLMKIKTYNCNFNLINKNDFKYFIKKEDEKLRCFIQNSVFDENGRIPLVPYDIRLEADEDYYIEDLCIFIMHGNNAVGYGQVILKKGLYTIVNVGILEKYRGKGYGEKLIQHLLFLCYKKSIHDVYINVDSSNSSALQLYRKVGFEEYGKITTWNKIH